MNRLSKEKSPYLLQHADNPVDWYPWGDEAISEAKKLNKPIFLSIGYSTCHWCHVMAHESFEDKATAELMNKLFINIKVDREERPDLDAVYMTAVQMIAGNGGWPMSVWLTPDLKPFYGGTYFPPEDMHGRPGFQTVLTELASLWKKENARVAESADNVAAAIDNAYRSKAPASDRLPDPGVVFETALKSFSAMYDSVYGGFGSAPKFPMPVYMEALLSHYSRTKNPQALDMVNRTIRRMAEGGIYDQLGGGFARYSTDERWIVPHFEKMLYDNAQLISITARLFQLTGDSYFADLTRNAIAYILRDLRHFGGAFYSAEDADSEGKEGTFYLWTLNEIKSAVGPDADLFIRRFGVTVNGNFFDPHTRESGKNILVQAAGLDDMGKEFKKTLEEIQTILTAAQKKLFDLRAKRPRPHLDDKILTEWNGLMISALAKAGTSLDDSSYILEGAKAASFILKELYDAGQKRLFRRWRDGERKIEAQQADYALLIQGLLDLFEASADAEWLAWARTLQHEQDNLFFDKEQGGYFMNVVRDDLLVRIKDDGDNVIPSGNSIAALNGLRLSKLLEEKGFSDNARKTLLHFSNRLSERPHSLPIMLQALLLENQPAVQIIILGEKSDSRTKDLVETARNGYPESALLIIEPGKQQSALEKILPFIGSMQLMQEKPTAYACFNFSCKIPTNDPVVLRNQLDELAKKNYNPASLH